MVVKMQKTVLLTFDTEEFDVFKEPIFDVTSDGAEKVLDLLDKHKIKATFFVTGVFAQSNKFLIKKISKKHEVASHGYSHQDDYKTLDKETAYNLLYKTNIILKKITSKNIIGYRAPRFRGTTLDILKRLGFKYDSSINPILIPGRYNYLFHTRNIKIEKHNQGTECEIRFFGCFRFSYRLCHNGKFFSHCAGCCFGYAFICALDKKRKNC